MSGTLRSALGRTFRRAALPLGCYYAVTLGLPIANGAASAGSRFVGHALVVSMLPPMLIAMACTLAVAAEALWLKSYRALRSVRSSGRGTPKSGVPSARQRTGCTRVWRFGSFSGSPWISL
jgi:hypothetical protein